MAFKITSLDKSQFAHLFGMSDQELTGTRTVRMIADKKPGYPCRVSLTDADIGEEVMLMHYEHLPVETPYRASYAIYVRPGAARAIPDVNEIPEALRERVLSLRGFKQPGTLVSAELAEGKDLAMAIENMFLDSAVSFIQIHFAKPGCYAARVDRA